MNPGDCEVMYEGALTNTIDTVGPVTDYFRDFVLEVVFIEDTVDLNNYEKPLQKNLSQTFQYRFNAKHYSYLSS